METRSGLLGLGLGLGLGYLLWKQGGGLTPSSSAKSCPPCDPSVGASGCEAGSKDAALTIADFKKRNSTWIPGLLPTLVAGLDLLSVPARSDNARADAPPQWQQSYRDCFGSTLTTFGLTVDENGKVSAK